MYQGPSAPTGSAAPRHTVMAMSCSRDESDSGATFGMAPKTSFNQLRSGSLQAQNTAQQSFGQQAQNTAQNTAQQSFGQQAQNAQQSFGQQAQSVQQSFVQQAQNAQQSFGQQAQNVQQSFGQQAQNTAQNAQQSFGQQAQSAQQSFVQQAQNTAQQSFGQHLPRSSSQTSISSATSSQPKLAQQAQNAAQNTAQQSFGQQAQNAQQSFGQQAQNVQQSFGQQAQNTAQNAQQSFGQHLPRSSSQTSTSSATNNQLVSDQHCAAVIQQQYIPHSPSQSSVTSTTAPFTTFATLQQAPVPFQSHHTFGLAPKSGLPGGGSTTPQEFGYPAPSSRFSSSSPAPGIPVMTPPPRQGASQTIADSHMTFEQRQLQQQRQMQVNQQHQQDLVQQQQSHQQKNFSHGYPQQVQPAQNAQQSFNPPNVPQSFGQQAQNAVQNHGYLQHGNASSVSQGGNTATSNTATTGTSGPSGAATTGGSFNQFGVSSGGTFGSRPVTQLQASRMADPSKLPPASLLAAATNSQHQSQSFNSNSSPGSALIGTAALRPPPGSIQGVPQGYYQSHPLAPSGAGAGAAMSQSPLPSGAASKPLPRKKTYATGKIGVVDGVTFDKPIGQFSAMPEASKEATVLTGNIETDTIVSCVLKGKSVTDCLIRHSHCDEVYLKGCNVDGGVYSCCTFKKCKIKDLENSFDCRFEQCDFDGKCTPTRPTLSKCGWK